MKCPECVIAEAIVFDNRPSSNARRILEALREEGYVVVPRRGRITYPLPVVPSEEVPEGSVVVVDSPVEI